MTPGSCKRRARCFVPNSPPLFLTKHNIPSQGVKAVAGFRFGWGVSVTILWAPHHQFSSLFYSRNTRVALKPFRNRVLVDDNRPCHSSSETRRGTKGIRRIALPAYSPDLMPWVFGGWIEIERRLKRQEQKMPSTTKEPMAKFRKRLARTVHSLPRSFFNKLVRNFMSRLNAVYLSRGGLIGSD